MPLNPEHFKFNRESGLYVPNRPKNEEPEENEPKKKTAPGCQLIYMLIQSVVVIILVKIFKPDAIPFEIFSFWKIRSGYGDWIRAGAPIIAWYALLNLFLIFVVRKRLEQTSRIIRLPPLPDYRAIRTFGIGIGVIGAVIEELIFRWLWFLHSIVILKIINFILLGFIDLGIIERMHIYVFGPIFDLITFHKLHDVIFHESGWAVGAAMIASNALFRDGHKYQGFLGTTSAWVAGMYFFWLLFNHGLLSAIIIHAFCNFFAMYILSIYAEKQQTA